MEINYNYNMKLRINGVSLSEASQIDGFGRVFFYDKKVFRAIFTDHVENCITLLNSELYNELLDLDLVPKSQVSDISLEEYPLVIEHERINESKQHHWSFSMFRDAALLTLKVNEVCNKHDYQLKDAHPYNVFFKKNKPIFIDFGSIIKKEKSTNSLNLEWEPHVNTEFISTFFVPLLIWSKGDFFLARKLIEDGNHPAYRTVPMTRLLDSPLIKQVESDIYNSEFTFRNRTIISKVERIERTGHFTKISNNLISKVFKRPTGSFALKRTLKNYLEVKDIIISLSRPKVMSFWENYHDTYQQKGKVNTTPRFDRIIELVKTHTFNVHSAIDLAGNQGVFSQLLSESMDLKRVVLTDYDEKAIDKAYLVLKEIPDHNIEPYLFNFMIPFRKDEIQLLKCDIVFALAITHHLILTQKFFLSLILSRISEFSNRFVVIEFMPIGLYNGGEIPDVPVWYTTEWFRSEFLKHFYLKVEEKLELNRIVFIGEKIK